MTGPVILGRAGRTPLPKADFSSPPGPSRGSQLSDGRDNGGQIGVMSLDLFSQPTDAIL